MTKTKPTTLIAIYALLLFGVLFAIFPIYFVVQASLRPGNQLYSTQLQLIPYDATLANYVHVLANTEFPRWIGNSILVGFVTVIATLFITVPAGYALSRFGFRGRGGILAGMLVLNAFPGLLAITANYLLLSALGLINTHFGLILIYAAGATVFNTWNLKGYYDTIPIDLEEAAMIDGCTPTQAFIRIMLPLARPSIAITALFGFLAGFGDFIFSGLVLYDEALYTAPLGIISLQEGYRTPWGWFAAAALMMSVPVTALFMYLQRNFVSGLASGGVK
jgi:arabinogalactan oligomer/maltooligosaccharide transport system permease protein